MVLMKLSVKVSSVNLSRRDDLPTPLSPTMRILKRWS
jgi:hypothetical protein